MQPPDGFATRKIQRVPGRRLRYLHDTTTSKEPLGRRCGLFACRASLSVVACLYGRSRGKCSATYVEAIGVGSFWYTYLSKPDPAISATSPFECDSRSCSWYVLLIASPPPPLLPDTDRDLQLHTHPHLALPCLESTPHRNTGGECTSRLTGAPIRLRSRPPLPNYRVPITPSAGSWMLRFAGLCVGLAKSSRYASRLSSPYDTA